MARLGLNQVQSELGVWGSRTRNIKMLTEEKGKVFPQNQIPIDKDKLKEEQKVKLKAAIEAYEQ